MEKYINIKKILIGLLSLTLTACAAPIMQLQHANKINANYRNLGSVNINVLVDARPENERSVLKKMHVQPIEPVIYSGNAEPPLPLYLQHVMIVEAQRSNIFKIVKPADYELSGKIISLKAGELAGPYPGNFYMEPGMPRALFTSYQFAEVYIEVTLSRSDRVVFHYPIRLKLFRVSPNSISQRGTARQLAEYLDQAITIAVGQLFEKIDYKLTR